MPEANTEKDDWGALQGDLTEAFSPGAPIQERDLFAGRSAELMQLIDAVYQRGRHAVVYGERGVGKTSLVNIVSLATARAGQAPLYVRVNASPNDTYTSLWKKVFKRMSYQGGAEGGTRQIAEDYIGDLTPDDVQLELQNLDAHQVPIVVLDEFDRIQDKSATVLVADTIKALSDYSVPATVVIVGVADSVTELIQGHQSVSRSLLQVKMPRMSPDELGDIIFSRYKRCGVEVDGEALWKMTFLSRGLPHYAHLLGMYAGRFAANQQQRRIHDEDVDNALDVALADVDQSIKEDYYKAVTSQRKEALYESVLVACALAQTDELGRFQQSAVAEPLNKIAGGKHYTAATFAFHMNAMCEEARGAVLERKGEAHNPRYRFAEPLMQPFAILKGLRDGLINDEIAQIFATRRQLKLSI